MSTKRKQFEIPPTQASQDPYGYSEEDDIMDFDEDEEAEKKEALPSMKSPSKRVRKEKEEEEEEEEEVKALPSGSVVLYDANKSLGVVSELSASDVQLLDKAVSDSRERASLLENPDTIYQALKKDDFASLKAIAYSSPFQSALFSSNWLRDKRNFLFERVSGTSGDYMKIKGRGHGTTQQPFLIPLVSLPDSGIRFSWDDVEKAATCKPANLHMLLNPKPGDPKLIDLGFRLRLDSNRFMSKEVGYAVFSQIDKWVTAKMESELKMEHKSRFQDIQITPPEGVSPYTCGRTLLRAPISSHYSEDGCWVEWDFFLHKTDKMKEADRKNLEDPKKKQYWEGVFKKKEEDFQELLSALPEDKAGWLLEMRERDYELVVPDVFVWERKEIEIAPGHFSTKAFLRKLTPKEIIVDEIGANCFCALSVRLEVNVGFGGKTAREYLRIHRFYVCKENTEHAMVNLAREHGYAAVGMDPSLLDEAGIVPFEFDKSSASKLLTYSSSSSSSSDE